MEGILVVDGFDKAILGFDDNSQKVVYSIERMIKILVKQYEKELRKNPNAFDEDDDLETMAIEYLEFNVFGAYVGEHTPMYIHEMKRKALDEYIDSLSD